MELHIKTYDNVLVLAPAGRIDHTNCDRFLEAIQPHVERCTACGPRLVFDLGQLEYVSSAGLRCFLIAAKQIKPRAGTVAVAAMRPVVREIFEISRFNLLFPTFDTLRAAMAKLAPGALPAFDASSG
jgi:anti-sigma B factor antagonist